MRDRSAIESKARSLDPTTVHPTRWAIWFPVALTAALLLAIAINVLMNWRPIAKQRDLLANVMRPAAERLIDLQLAFDAEIDAVRAYGAEPGPESAAQFWTIHERRLDIVNDIRMIVPRAGPEFVQEFDRLQDGLAKWDRTAVALVSGQITVEEFRARGQDRAAQAAFASVSRLDVLITNNMRSSLASMEAIERRRLIAVIGFLTLALISAPLTARYGEQARALNWRLERRAAEEALLRDAMASLTGAEVVPQALDRIAAIAMRVGGVGSAYIEESDGARSTVVVVGGAGPCAPPRGTRALYPGSVTDHLVRVTGPDVDHLTSCGQDIGAFISGQCGQCPGIAVPIRREADPRGALVLICPAGGMPDAPADLLGHIRILADLAAIALWRMELDAVLQERRERLQTVIDRMPAGVIMAEAPSGRITMSNRHAINMLPGDVGMAQSIEDYSHWKAAHPDGRLYEPEEWPMARSIRTGEQVEGEEIELPLAGGRRGTIRVGSAPIRDRLGHIVAAVGTIYDITEQKRREFANRFLSEASRALASSLDYDETLRAVLRLIVPQLADGAIAYVVEDGAGNSTIRRIQPVASDPSRNEAMEAIASRYPIPLDSPHPAAIAIRTGKPQLIPEVSVEELERFAQDSDHLRLLRELDIHSAIIAPLVVRGKTLGALLFISSDPARRYGPDDLALAEELARRAALAVDNAGLFCSISAAEKRARFLAETTQILSGSIEYEETIGRVAQLAVPSFADFAIAFLTDAKGNTWKTAAAHRDKEKQKLVEDSSTLSRPMPSNLASTITRAVQTRQPILVEDVTPEVLESLQLDPRIREIIDALAVVSWIAVPLVARDATIGAMLFGSAESARHFDKDDLFLAEQLASRAALAMQNSMFLKEVQDALRTRDDVLATVSHDLRNPLHTISMSADLLLEGGLDTEQLRHKLEIIQKAVQQMDRLIQDLLDVARIQAGKTLAMELQREPARGIIIEACESFMELARDREVQLEWVAPDRLPDVHADRGRVLQVLSNLIRNALEFTPKAGRVEVRARARDDVVEFCVADTGAGIKPEDRDRIFAPFWQATRTERKGAGLGLAIARGIIDEHSGQIWVDSDLGAGSTFCFTLPVASGMAEQERAAE